jgi:hypothetical protein
VVITDQDAGSELDAAREALDAARISELNHMESFEIFDEYERQVQRAIELGSSSRFWSSRPPQDHQHRHDGGKTIPSDRKGL